MSHNHAAIDDWPPSAQKTRQNRAAHRFWMILSNNSLPNGNGVEPIQVHIDTADRKWTKCCWVESSTFCFYILVELSSDASTMHNAHKWIWLGDRWIQCVSELYAYSSAGSFFFLNVNKQSRIPAVALRAKIKSILRVCLRCCDVIYIDSTSRANREHAIDKISA